MTYLRPLYWVFMILLMSQVEAKAQFGKSWSSWEVIYEDEDITVEIKIYTPIPNSCVDKNKSFKFKYRLTGKYKKEPTYLNWKIAYEDCNGLKYSQQNSIELWKRNFENISSGVTVPAQDKQFNAKEITKKYYDIKISSSKQEGAGLLPPIKLTGLLAQENFDKAVKLNDEGVALENGNEWELGFQKYRQALGLLLESGDSVGHIGLIYANMAYNLFQRREYEQAIINMKKGVFYYEKAGHARRLPLIGSVHDLGVMYEQLNNIDSACYYYHKAFDKAQSVLGTNDPEAIRFYNSSGYCHRLEGRTTRAINLFRKSFNILTEHNSGNYKWLEISATNLGDSYNWLAINDSSLYYYRKALYYSKKYRPQTSIELARAYYNVAGILNNMGLTDQSIIYLDSAYLVHKNVIRNPDEKAEFYYRGAQIEFDAKNYSAAKRHFLQCVDHLKIDRLKIRGDAFLRVAGILMLEGHFDEAKIYLERACDIYKTDFGEDNYKTKITCEQVENAVSWNRKYIKNLFPGMTDLEIFEEIKKIANTDEPLPPELNLLERQLRAEGTKETMAFDLFEAFEEFRKGNYEATLSIIQKGFVGYFPEFKDTFDFDKNPNLNGLYPEPGNLYSYFLLKALTYQEIWMGYNDPNALFNAYDLYEKADTLFSEIRLNSTDEDKVNIGEQIDALYKGISMVSSQLYDLTGDEKYLEKAFYASEKTKAFSLLPETVDETKLKKLAPDSILHLERSLKEELLFNRRMAFQKGNDPSAKEAFFDTQKSLLLFHEKLKKYYPEFWETKYGIPIVGLEDFTNVLDNQTLVISFNYFPGNIIDIAYLSNEKCEFVFGKHVKDLDKNIELLNSLILSKDDNIEKYKDLINYLSKNVLPDIPDFVQKLVIIPEGKLFELPFHVLVDNEIDQNMQSFKEFPFIIKKKSISYGLSSTILYHHLVENEFKESNKAALIYDPFKLGISKNLAHVAELTDTDTLIILEGEQATKDDLFSRNLEEFQTVHIVSHVDDKWSVLSDSGILLEDETVYYDDFYGLNAAVDLFSLVGCGSGKGRVIAGEGLIGLNRALFVAGASNILLSKYRVKVNVAINFIQYFNEQLIATGKKLPYAQIVRKTQQHLLKNSEYSNPWYWSGFQLWGL